MLRASAAVIAGVLGCCPLAAAAQSTAEAPPADFAAAAAACIAAVSPDKLDTAKLKAMGWTKQSDERAPFGITAAYTHAGNAARILASPTPSGYCIVDGYAKDFSQFEPYQTAIAERLRADYGTTGLSNVSIGQNGSDDRRQGFVIGNAVAGYSGAMRTGGFNLRFAVVNAKFAGSAEVFQTSRPPLSEAEIAENRAKDHAAYDFARQPGTAQDLVAAARDCAIAIRGDGALPGNGWRKSIHASGSPRGMEALKRGDRNGMLAGMAQTSQVLYFVGRHGLVTKYYVRGVTNVCEAKVYAEPAAIEAMKAEAVRLLALVNDQTPSGKAKEFVGEYMLPDLSRTYQWEQLELGFRQGSSTSTDGPDAGMASLSIYIF
jgi:hypothetical protein